MTCRQIGYEWPRTTWVVVFDIPESREAQRVAPRRRAPNETHFHSVRCRADFCGNTVDSQTWTHEYTVFLRTELIPSSSPASAALETVLSQKVFLQSVQLCRESKFHFSKLVLPHYYGTNAHDSCAWKSGSSSLPWGNDHISFKGSQWVLDSKGRWDNIGSSHQTSGPGYHQCLQRRKGKREFPGFSRSSKLGRACLRYPLSSLPHYHIFPTITHYHVFKMIQKKSTLKERGDRASRTRKNEWRSEWDSEEWVNEWMRLERMSHGGEVPWFVGAYTFGSPSCKPGSERFPNIR